MIVTIMNYARTFATICLIILIGKNHVSQDVIFFTRQKIVSVKITKVLIYHLFWVMNLILNGVIRVVTMN